MSVSGFARYCLSGWLLLLGNWLVLTANVAAGVSIVPVATVQLNPTIDVVNPAPHALGRQLWFLHEPAETFTWPQALAEFQQQRAQQSEQEVLSFGIGAAPHWVYLSLHNTAPEVIERKLLIDTSWLDQLDVYLLNEQGSLLQSWRAGDAQVFGSRTRATSGFVFPLMLAPGTHQLLIRVATPDPFILPLYLVSPQVFETNVMQNYYSYGFSYGYLLALIAFNALLYFGLRDSRHLLYAIYLSIFMLTNISYTGHGFAWLWPDFPEWQRWAQPILMVIFGTSGLVFAISFLSLRDYCYRLYCAVLGIVAVTACALLLAIIVQQQVLALLIAFAFIAVYPLTMLLMGICVLPYNTIGAGYYLAATIVGVLGVALTTASVWGLVPYANWSFRAVEIGMLLEATLLALALAARIRQVQKRQQLAEQLASTDPLTGLNNRRAFYVLSPSLWSNSVRYSRSLSAILLDMDRFKQLNDTHGHACGDQVLKQLSQLLQLQARQSDFVARWGGEEFLILLPETSAQDAHNFAERLREQWVAQHIVCGNNHLHVSASFGVAERRSTDSSIDQLIERADTALYQAKHAGRNCTRTISINDVVD